MERFPCADIRSQHWPERFGLELIGSQERIAACERLQLVGQTRMIRSPKITALSCTTRLIRISA